MLQKNNKYLLRTPLAQLLKQAGRFEAFSRKTGGILLDFSRVQIDQEAFGLLLDLADRRDLAAHVTRLFSGEAVNMTKHRPALHMALRSPRLLSGVSPEDSAKTRQAMERMFEIAETLHAGRHPGEQGANIRHIVHVGIGGSALGTRLICDALPVPENNRLQVHFLGSIDAHQRQELLGRIDPAETVVVLVSKSFTTGDTLLHGKRLRHWLERKLGAEAARQRLFAVTSRTEVAEAAGIVPQQIMYLPEWVGGRYSLWSPVSLSAAALAGPEPFGEMLDGAAVMDQHFISEPHASNLPVIMGLLGVWHRNVCGYSAWGVIPYDHRLRLLPAHLQQLIMESNGKRVTAQGEPVSGGTAPAVFGGPGTDAQHSLFQAFHQGTDTVPLNIVAVIRPCHDDFEAHSELLANMLAQVTALAAGRSDEETREWMQASGETDIDTLAPHRAFPGNRPSELLILDELTPAILGQLLALYEHKVFVESVLWRINAFDQWGVELGKSMIGDIKDSLQTGQTTRVDLSGILDHIRQRS